MSYNAQNPCEKQLLIVWNSPACCQWYSILGIYPLNVINCLSFWQAKRVPPQISKNALSRWCQLSLRISCLRQCCLPLLQEEQKNIPNRETGRKALISLVERSFLCGGSGLVSKLCSTLVTTWTAACRAPLSMGFSRQEYWSGLPFPSAGDIPDPAIKLWSPTLQADSLWRYVIVKFSVILKCAQGIFQMVLLLKNLPDNAGDIRGLSLIPGLGRSPGGGNDNSLQYSCLENPMDRGAWWTTVHGVAESDMTETN